MLPTRNWRLHFCRSFGRHVAFPAAIFQELNRSVAASENHKSRAAFEAPHSYSRSEEQYDSLIEKYRISSSSHGANRFHGDALKNGIVADLFIANTIISRYAGDEDMLSALDVFDEMPVRNSVTWSCLISGYTSNGMSHDAFSAFRDMISVGFSPNHYSLGSALRACQKLGEDGGGLKHGIQIHGLISKTRYGSDVVVCNVLISMYGSCSSSSEEVRSDRSWLAFQGIANKNSISWNSIISIYSRRGDAFSAFSLFSDMQKEGFGIDYRPTEYTFTSLITAASESPDHDRIPTLLEQLLARIEMSGFSQDLYVGSALVNGFARCGAVDAAKKVFRHMGVKNAVSLNGLMVGLVKQKKGEEAFDIFLKSRGEIRFNADTYVLVSTSFGEFRCPEVGKRKGKEIHGYLIRKGSIDSSVAVGNSLINMYAKCEAVEDACSVFETMVDKDAVSWSSLISGLDRNGCFEDALSSLRSMKRDGSIRSNFTLISGLSSCSGLLWIKMGEQIHCESVKLGLNDDVSVSNTLLSLYADAGCMNECGKVFGSMRLRDRVSWNSMIRASAVDSAAYFTEMLRAGWDPDGVTFINVLASAASRSDLRLARQIHSSVLKWNCREEDGNALENSLLTCYGKCGEVDDSERIFSRMTGGRDDISWNSMISGYIRSERLADAMELVSLMLRDGGKKPDRFTFATVLSACASVATLVHGMEVHACAVRACSVSDVFVGSALVDMYAKCGRIEYASKVFASMPLRNVYTWNSMVSGYARHGDGSKALQIFDRMKEESQVPDHVTFVGVLSACSHMGLIDEGYRHFESMRKEYQLVPQVEHFSCMVDLLGRAGEFDKLEEFVDGMPMSPNVLIWRTVLAACGRAKSRRLLDLGTRAAEKITELEPENAVTYILLANMYASGERWESMAAARRRIKTASAGKEAGCSWVCVKDDGVHVFVSGGKSHPRIDAIHEKLGELHREMKARGYVPETRHSSLHDLELENKEEILSHHSERLAVAFVLTLKKKSDMPIRIMKNLRVCVDCHTAFKYISEIVAGRQIVLRDSNRFHHFKDGECSCNDYW
ncbi:hypothetical protein M569_12493 [Genlisea aurea]|uniref:DYW domain-containing protein n=1 Tax=Genlisea aurea TaxID=192259 RepID=S8CCX9_9LAMI|nr:hypothetical protein M569_12493 [Genlisea aurea]